MRLTSYLFISLLILMAWQMAQASFTRGRSQRQSTSCANTRSISYLYPQRLPRAFSRGQVPFRSVASSPSRRRLHESTDMVGIRFPFTELAARRRASRSSSLLEQLSRASSSRDGCPSSSSDAREEDPVACWTRRRRACTLSGIYTNDGRCGGSRRSTGLTGTWRRCSCC